MGLADNFRSNSQNFQFKRYIIIGLVVALLGLVWFIGSPSRRKNANTLTPNEYYDQRSGETVSDPEGKQPDTYGNVSGAPIYLGISNLLDYGVTIGQINAMKDAFYNYSVSKNANIKEVSIGTSTITPAPTDPSSRDPKQTLTFTVQFNRETTYDAQLDYFGVTSIRLFLRDRNNNKIIYDSGDMHWDSSPPGE